MRRWPSYALLTFLLAIFAAFLVYPIWLTIKGGFESADPQNPDGLTLYHVQAVFENPVLRRGLVHAFLIALCTTGLCLLIAVPLATLSAKFDFPGKAALGALILVPLILPPFVGAIGLRHILGRSGALNTLLIHLGLLDPLTPSGGGGIDFIARGGFWAIVVIEALHLYPILYLNVTAALANLDPALEDAAENLGAGRWRRFTRITLPLIRPGLFAGATICFIWSFTELGTPLMFEYHEVTPVQIFNGIREMEVSKQPYALTAVMVAAAAMCYGLGRFAFGGRAYAMYSKASLQATCTRLKPLAGALATGTFTLIFALAVIPHAGVVLSSFTVSGQWYESILPRALTGQHYVDALGHSLAVGSIRNSLFYASIAVLIDLVLGLLIGYLLVRAPIVRWLRALLDSLAMIPLAVPGLVMAFGYIAMTLRWPFEPGMPEWLAFTLRPVLPGTWFGQLNDGPLHGVADVIGAEPNPIPLLIIAFAIRRLPYVVRATVAGLEQTSVELEDAAVSLGASRLRTIRSIVIPLIAANLVAGGLLAFSFAMLEVSDSLILAQREAHFPITKAIYVLFERLGDGPYIASAMGVWAMALLAVTLIGASMLMGRRLGAMFRV